MSKNRIAALGAGAVSAALVGSAVFAPAAVAQDFGPQPSPSAYAVQAEGLLDIPRTPFVEGTGEKHVVQVEVPKNSPALTVEVLNARSDAGTSTSDSNIAHVNIGGAHAPQGGIDIKAVSATCEPGKASMNIAKLVIGGQEIPIGEQIPPNSGAQLPEQLDQLIDLTLNKQTENSDGSTTVTAVSIELLKAAADVGLNQKINLASATCGPAENGGTTTPPTTPPDNGDGDKGNGDDDKGNGGADDAEDDGMAPTPVPQPDHIAVTG